MMNLANQVIQTCHFLTKPKPSHLSTTALYVILPTVFLFKHQSKNHYKSISDSKKPLAFNSRVRASMPHCDLK